MLSCRQLAPPTLLRVNITTPMEQSWGTEMLDIVWIIAALLASLGGLVSLWRGWREGADMRPRVALAAALWVLSSALWILRFGAEIGIPLALETAAIVAFAFILSRMERRTGRPPRARVVTVPPPARRRYLVGTLRALVAGPLGLIASLGIAVVIATRAPMAEQTRLILAGLIVPTLWAIGIAWVVCQRRLTVQALSFGAIGATSLGLAFLAGA